MNRNKPSWRESRTLIRRRHRAFVVDFTRRFATLNPGG